MLSPTTAESGLSIWDWVDRGKFENDVVALSQTNGVPEPHIYDEAEWPQQGTQALLPFALERQVADDLAFIAAYDYGVDYVTAATLEASNDPPCLTIRLAANEGVKDCVKRAFEQLLNTLQSLLDTGTELRVENCAEEVFDIIVALNINRIFGRLESRWFHRPLYDRGGPRGPLTERLKRSISPHRLASHLSQSSPDYATLSAQVETFNLHFRELESSDESTRVSVAKLVVKDAFYITLDGVSLSSRLQTLRISTDARTIQETNKLANYWRISRGLAYLSRARAHRALFANLKLDTLPYYRPSRSAHTRQKQHVHAEIQTIVYYETSSSTWPRAIGSSKEACFLCDAFIKAHGSFHVSKAHRQVFSQWTVPDLRDYSSETLTRLRSALVVVDQAVIKEYNRACCRQGSQPFPIQSSINLQRAILPTPSVSTIRPSICESTVTVSPRISCRESRLSTPKPTIGAVYDEILILGEANVTSVASLPTRTAISAQSVPQQGFTANHGTADYGIADTEKMLLCPLETPFTTSPKPNNGISLAVDPKSPADLSFEWLDLSIHLEDTSRAANSKPTAALSNHGAHDAHVFLKAEVIVECVEEYDSRVRGYIDLADLVPGEERLIERSDDEEGGLDLTIVNGHNSAVKMRCMWLSA